MAQKELPSGVVTKRVLFWVIVIGMVALDQWVKYSVRAAIPVHGSIAARPFPGIFELTLTYNEGIAFGQLKGAGVYLTPVAIAIASVSAWYAWKHPEESKLSHVALGLLAAGALGNLYDRLFLRQVTDMFWFRLIDFPVFNVADACITVASILLVLVWWTEAAKKKPSPALSNDTQTP